jgi:hypothetical protein
MPIKLKQKNLVGDVELEELEGCREIIVRWMLWKQEDGSGSGLCSVAVCGITSGVEP